MTDRPVDEIRPGDRVYLSAGPFEGDIVRVVDVRDNGMSVTGFGKWVMRADKPLRILQPGDVIPAGAEYTFVQPSGELQSAEVVFDRTLTVSGGHCVILSMPTPEPSREEQRAKLVEARADALSAWKDAEIAWRVADEKWDAACDALEKFDAEDPS